MNANKNHHAINMIRGLDNSFCDWESEKNMNAVACMLAILSAGAESDLPSQTTVMIVVGAEGTPEYGRMFAAWAERWEQAARRGGADTILLGDAKSTADSDRDRLRQLLHQESAPTDKTGTLWLVLIGHGTFDGRTAKFNLRGPDVSAGELSTWIAASNRHLVIINCASSSGPFVSNLSGPNRVVITATKSGQEHNFARFGDFLSQSIADPLADLDKDGQTSLLEAYLKASRQTEEFYRTEGRLATEHALLDDNGDGQGTRADWFRGIRPVKRPAVDILADGHRAHQFHVVRSTTERKLPSDLRMQRDRLELAVVELRDRKRELDADEYYRQLESLLVPLAEIYEQAESHSTPPQQALSKRTSDLK